MTELVLAVDGGNVKTDLALLDTSGALLSLVRGTGCSPHYVGIDGCVAVLRRLLAQALEAAHLESIAPRPAAAQIMLAGADLPEELAALRPEIEALAQSERTVIDNDTLALLRSGTDRGWGVAVVCGGGINCVGVAPDGRTARFLSLGQITGDWGGGYDVGLAALSAAARGADGRGPRTPLEADVPAFFGMDTPADVARAVQLGTLAGERLGELSRVVFPAAAEDPVAAGIVRRLTDEVVAFACTALRRLELLSEAPDIVLGGGLLRAAPASAIEDIARGVAAEAPAANVVIARSAPIVGAALLGFDALGVNSSAAIRAREEMGEAFAAIEGDGSRVLTEAHDG